MSLGDQPKILPLFSIFCQISSFISKSILIIGNKVNKVNRRKSMIIDDYRSISIDFFDFK